MCEQEQAEIGEVLTCFGTFVPRWRGVSQGVSDVELSTPPLPPLYCGNWREGRFSWQKKYKSHNRCGGLDVKIVRHDFCPENVSKDLAGVLKNFNMYLAPGTK